MLKAAKSTKNEALDINVCVKLVLVVKVGHGISQPERSRQIRMLLFTEELCSDPCNKSGAR